ncbi:MULTISPECIES: hypothetical protein [unclassified Streptomyces]|uniref:hypothetical protein n=1 Tax=unclassified Streptomyces TaxID=2593676 RepID=UPI00211D183E|nr:MULTISPECIES: hypothetical protein [unclassified Streptomyces]
MAEYLRPERPLRTRHQDLPSPTELFGHLGLAEPQSEKGVRWAGVCPLRGGQPPERGRVDRDPLDLELDADATRVHIQAY